MDGKVGRVKKRSETWNATANQWNYPQTPARVQLSIWPGGADSNAQGTIDWAGGAIDWQSSDIQKHGYDFATVGEVTVECYNAKSGPGTNLHTSYTYDDYRATNDTIVDGTKRTTLKSFAGTGLDMDAGGSDTSSSGTASASSAAATAPTIPGGTASGPGSAPGEDSNGNSGSGTSGGDSSSSVQPSNCQATGFSQDGCTSSGTASGSGTGGQSAGVRVERILGASAFAALVAVAGLFLF